VSSGNVFVKGFTNPNSALFGLFPVKTHIWWQEEYFNISLLLLIPQKYEMPLPRLKPAKL